MAGIGEKLWEMGRSPPQHLSLLVFGLVGLLTGFITSSLLLVVGGGSGSAIALAALVLRDVGAFFVEVDE